MYLCRFFSILFLTVTLIPVLSIANTVQHNACLHSSIDVYSGQYNKPCTHNKKEHSDRFYSHPLAVNKALPDNKSGIVYYNKPGTSFLWDFAGGEYIIFSADRKKRITKFPSAAYGRYVPCNMYEMAYLGFKNFSSLSKSDGLCHHYEGDPLGNMKKYLSSTCFQFISPLVNAHRKDNLCYNNRLSKTGESILSNYFSSNGMSNNFPSYGSPVASMSFKPYPNAMGYYPEKRPMHDLICSNADFNHAQPCVSPPAGYIYDGLKNFYTNSVHRGQTYVDKRRIDWAFPSKKCAEQGCPLLIIFAGGGSQWEKYWGYNYNLYKQQKTISCADAPFSNEWSWPESEGHPLGQLVDSNASFSYSYYVRMNLLKAILAKGYAVVFVNPWPVVQSKLWDDWAFAPQSCPADKHGKSSLFGSSAWKNSFNLLWPGNDKYFLYRFFKDLISNHHSKEIINTSGDHFLSSRKVDINNIFLMGYSSGAHMVSRLINELAIPFHAVCSKDNVLGKLASDEQCYWLPTIDGGDPTSRNTLQIRGAIMLSGASYYSYSDCPGTTPHSTDAVGAFSCLACKQDVKNCPLLSDKYSIGQISEANGCAAVNYLEEQFQDEALNLINMQKHPPVMLAQSNFDDYADRDVSRYYYFLMKSSKYSREHVYRISSNHPYTGHIYFPEMVIPTVNFMQKYRIFYDK